MGREDQGHSCPSETASNTYRAERFQPAAGWRGTVCRLPRVQLDHSNRCVAGPAKVNWAMVPTRKGHQVWQELQGVCLHDVGHVLFVAL
jgi:hypothetical protein